MLAPSTRTAVRLALLGVALLGPQVSTSPAADPPAVRWRTDYNAARKEAQDRGLSLFVEVTSDDCLYCRKLEATTLRDPAVVALLTTDFVPLKVNAAHHPELAKAMKVQLYPTMVLAGADGRIHGFLEGYMDADRVTDHMKRTVAVASTADWMARDFQEATKALAVAEYPRAVSLLRGITKEAGEKPVGVKAKQILAEVEGQGAGRLARAKDLETRGLTHEAMDTLTDLMKAYAGTQAATDAATRMAGLADKPETQEKLKLRRARDLLALAKEEFRTQRYYDCLQHCEQIGATFADLPESKEANALAAEVQGNPDRLAAACEQMNDRTAAMYATLAESWMKKGQDKEALACLEKVMKLAPNSRHAEVAQVQLTKIQGRTTPAVPAGFKKP
jgi:thioredoxin-related protein